MGYGPRCTEDLRGCRFGRYPLTGERIGQEVTGDAQRLRATLAFEAGVAFFLLPAARRHSDAASAGVRQKQIGTMKGRIPGQYASTGLVSPNAQITERRQDCIIKGGGACKVDHSDGETLQHARRFGIRSNDGVGPLRLFQKRSCPGC